LYFIHCRFTVFKLWKPIDEIIHFSSEAVKLGFILAAVSDYARQAFY
jgi:hypothetical protein